MKTWNVHLESRCYQAELQVLPFWAAAILDFRLPLESDVFRSITVRILDQDHLLFAFGIVLLSGLQTEQGCTKGIILATC